MTVLAVATFAELKGAVEGCARVIQIVDDIVFDAEPVTIASQCSQPMAFVGLGGQRRFAASGEHHFINIESGVEASFEFIDFVGGTNTDKEGNSGGAGGAVSIYSGLGQFKSCAFRDCQRVDFSGGAIYVNDGTLVLENCIFSNNKAAVGGGAIALTLDSVLLTVDTVFVNNSCGSDFVCGDDIDVSGEDQNRIDGNICLDGDQLPEIDFEVVPCKLNTACTDDCKWCPFGTSLVDGSCELLSCPAQVCNDVCLSACSCGDQCSVLPLPTSSPSLSSMSIVTKTISEEAATTSFVATVSSSAAVTMQPTLTPSTSNVPTERVVPGPNFPWVLVLAAVLGGLFLGACSIAILLWRRRRGRARGNSRSSVLSRGTAEDTAFELDTQRPESPYDVPVWQLSVSNHLPPPQDKQTGAGDSAIEEYGGERNPKEEYGSLSSPAGVYDNMSPEGAYDSAVDSGVYDNNRGRRARYTKLSDLEEETQVPIVSDHGDSGSNTGTMSSSMSSGGCTDGAGEGDQSSGEMDKVTVDKLAVEVDSDDDDEYSDDEAAYDNNAPTPPEFTDESGGYAKLDGEPEASIGREPTYASPIYASPDQEQRKVGLVRARSLMLQRPSQRPSPTRSSTTSPRGISAMTRQRLPAVEDEEQETYATVPEGTAEPGTVYADVAEGMAYETMPSR